MASETPISDTTAEPKKLYVAFYDPYPKDNDRAFERAAQTWSAAIEKSPGFRKGIDKVIFMEAGSDNEFIQKWNNLAKASRQEGFQVKEVNIFGHADYDRGNNKPGLDFARSRDPDPGPYESKDSTLTALDIQKLPKLPWHPEGLVVLSGCNTGNTRYSEQKWSSAQEFARSQGVPTSGNQGFSTFSSDPEEHVATNPKSPVMYLWPYNRSDNHGDFGAFNGKYNDYSLLGDKKAIPAALWDKNGKLVPESEHAQYFLKYGVKTTGPMTPEDRRAHHLLQELIQNSTKAMPANEAPNTAPEQTPKGKTPESASGNLNTQSKVVSQEQSREVLWMDRSYLGLNPQDRSEWLPTRILEHAQVSIQGARQAGFKNDPGTRYANMSDLTLSPQQQTWITQILPKWHATIEAHPDYAQEQQRTARADRNASWEQEV